MSGNYIKLSSSMPLPAGQTKPVKIPHGSKIAIVIQDPQPGVFGTLDFNYNGTVVNMPYPQSEEDANKVWYFNDIDQIVCFYNNSTGSVPGVIIVFAKDIPELAKVLQNEDPVPDDTDGNHTSMPIPAGQTRPVKLPHDRPIRVLVESPVGFEGYLAFYLLGDRAINYPQSLPPDPDTVFTFCNGICYFTNVFTAGPAPCEIIAHFYYL